MSNKFKLGLALFLFGFAGVLSMLTVSIDMPPEITARFSPAVLKLLILIGPTIYVVLTVLAGVALYQKVGLTVPAISSALKIEESKIKFTEQVKWGVLIGIISDVLIVIIEQVFLPYIPSALKAMGDKIKLTVLARFLYGGFTEEIIMRFGLMTIFVWLVFKVAKKLTPAVYWTGLLLAAILFAVGHFPIVFQTVQHPTAPLLLYILLGNSVAGIFFGWLYWKKGLEAAFIAHIFSHVIMLAAENVFHLQ